MRRILLAVASTVTGLVLLLSFKTHSSSATATPPAAISISGTTSTAGTSTSGSSTGTRTVTGSAVETRYGPVQVEITLSNGKLTLVSAVEYPETNSRDEQINAQAIPMLNQEAKQAGSANIDVVSGATYTSEGYIQSLQSALDQAKS